MPASPDQPEPLSGGPLGKLAGRVKEMAGALTGRRDLGREGRLQQVAAEDRERTAGKAAVADRKAEEADLEARRAAVAEERREVEVHAAEQAAEERIDARAEAKEDAAARAEEIADRLDPKDEG